MPLTLQIVMDLYENKEEVIADFASNLSLISWPICGHVAVSAR